MAAAAAAVWVVGGGWRLEQNRGCDRGDWNVWCDGVYKCGHDPAVAVAAAVAGRLAVLGRRGTGMAAAAAAPVRVSRGITDKMWPLSLAS